MALTKVSLINDGVIVVGHLHTNHGITTDHIGEGSQKYYSDTLVQNFLTTNNYVTSSDVANSLSTGAYFTSVSHDTVGRSLTFTKSDGATDSVNLTQYIDDTNLARLVSGTINSSTGIATFTRDDSSTFTVDFSALLDDTNDYVSSASFNALDGVLTLTRFGGTDVTVDLDGRYLRSFTETDPTVPSHVKAITTTNISNWNTAHGWGNHAGLYLPISGKAADSELLDGIDSSNFFRTDGTYPNTDMNDTVEGYWHVASGSANLPVNSYGHRWDYDHVNNGQWVFQMYSPTSGDVDLWYRQKRDYSATSWQKVLTSANIGSYAVTSESDTLDSVADRGNVTNQTLISTNTSGLRVDSSSYARIELDSTDNWSYVRFQDQGTTTWDIACYNSGNLEWRPGGGSANRMLLSQSGNLTMESGTVYIGSNAVIHAGNIGSQSVAYAQNANNLDGLNSTAYMRDDGWNTSPGQDADTQTGMRSDFSYSNNAPHTGDLIRFGSGNYSLQLSSQYGGSGQGFSFRTRNGDAATWNPWYQLIHAGNIGSQSVSNADTVDGYHASGLLIKSQPIFASSITEDTSGPLEFSRDNGWDDYIIKHGASKGLFGKKGFGWHMDSSSTFHVLSSGWTANFGVEHGGTAIAAGSFRAPVFYDSNNTSYYVDPSGTSNFLGPLNIYNPDGAANPRLSLGRNSAQGLHFSVDDRIATITHQQDEGSGEHSMEFYINSPTTSNNKVFRWRTNDGILSYLDSAGLKSNVYYDRDNTSYFLNPDTTGVSLKIKGGIVTDAPSGSILLEHQVVEANAWVFKENAANWGLYWFNAGSETHYNFGSYTTIGAEFFGFRNGSTTNSINPNAWTGINTVAHATWMLSNYSGDFWSAGTQYSATDMRAPIFYDSGNTGYYLNLDATSNLGGLEISGAAHKYLYITPGNGYEAMVRFNGGSGSTWYVGSRTSTQLVGSTDAWHVYSQTRGATVSGTNNAGDTFSRSSSRAPIFYDLDNTGYYCDPASTSNFNTVYLNAQDWGGTITWNTGVNINVSGESSFDLLGSSAIWQVWTANNSQPSIYVTYAGQTEIGRAGNRGLKVHGNLTVNHTSTYGTGMDLTFSGSSSTGMLIRNNTGSTRHAIDFYYSSAPVAAKGWVDLSSTGASFVNNSDYRLKQNVSPMTGSLDRLTQLKPSRFNFIGDDTIVDGFLAHEVEEVVPEAVSGEKDAVDDQGMIMPQGLDQSRMVPLLTAALQEAIAKIEDLEARIQSLEGQ